MKKPKVAIASLGFFCWFEVFYPAIIKYINTKNATTHAAMMTIVLVEIPCWACMVRAPDPLESCTLCMPALRGDLCGFIRPMFYLQKMVILSVLMVLLHLPERSRIRMK
jgi:hypothetical protein